DPTGLQYLRARYYNPATGRFTRLDPFAGNLNDPQSLHKYLYCHADPVMGVDPSGMTPEDIALGNAAHTIITFYYRAEHLRHLVEGNTHPWPGRPAGRPDITNFTQKTIAEIKKDNERERAAGHAQLTRDLLAMNTAQVAYCSTWGPDPWQPALRGFWIGMVNPLYKDWYGEITRNDSGVVLYRTFKKDSHQPRPYPYPFAVRVEEYETWTRNVFEKVRQTTTYEDRLAAAYVAQGAVLVTTLAGAGILGARILATTDLLQGRPSMYSGIAGATWATGFAATSSIFAGMFWNTDGF
ncbi:MAG: RHS repeat-associated core domain-containing protein, partial [Thermoguttaceae bacterium]|nr:RHS repeat-associated core domain-containing protein [Thermoguttaceae bacterium]